MGGGDAVVITKGDLLVIKFTNFVDYCSKWLYLDAEQLKAMQAAKLMHANALVYAIRTHLLPHKQAVLDRNVEAFSNSSEDLWSSATFQLASASDEVQDKVWRYLELFCELCSFSEATQ